MDGGGFVIVNWKLALPSFMKRRSPRARFEFSRVPPLAEKEGNKIGRDQNKSATSSLLRSPDGGGGGKRNSIEEKGAAPLRSGGGAPDEYSNR